MTLEEFLQRFANMFASGSLWTLGVAFLAGIVASAVCPCTLPVGIGMAGVVGAAEGGARRSGFLIAALFFAGIVVNLALLGALAGRLGGLLTESFGRYWALTMALLAMGAAIASFRWAGLNVDKLVSLQRPGLPGAFGYGFIFSLGTSVAPLLLLLNVAAAEGRAGYGFLLSAAFGLGRGLPFLLAGVFAGVLMRLMHLRSWRRGLRFASAGALLIVSVYYARVFAALL